ncbi:MAG: ATP-binding protein [Thermonemataceae bacterium]
MQQSYKTYCQRNNLKHIRAFVEKTLANTTLSDIEINQIVLAVDEICANLIIHSQKGNPKAEMEIIIECLPEEIIFQIIDFDASFFDFSAYKEPTITGIKKEGRKGGMGLLLVNSIMDEVEVVHRHNTNTWYLTKKIGLATT